MRRTAAQLRLSLDRQLERPWATAVLLVSALLAAAAVSAATGAVKIPIGTLPTALLSEAHELHGLLWNVRLPRIAVAGLVGAALATSGALLQTSVRNPLADPGLLGVTPGAGIGALIAILFFPEWMGLLWGFAFVGGALSLAVVLAIASLGQRAGGPLYIILTGVGMQAMLFAVIAMLTFFFADRAPAFVAFTVGSLGSAGWTDAGVALLPTCVGIAATLLGLRQLDALLLDDDSAGGIGVAVERTRLLGCARAALLTAGAVSGAGMVGFVGLMGPNAMRLIVGPRHRTLIPITVLGGALLVIATDQISRTLVAPLELPVGALLALIGGPFLLWLLWRRSV